VTTNGTPQGKPDVQTLRADIEQTRAELGETVQALAAKADVKARAKEQVEYTKQRVRDQVALATGRAKETATHYGHTVAEQAQGTSERVKRNPVPVAAVAAAAVALVAILVVIRRRR
jgi:ElaB/YqjD/DUF883 family membrane-anchored ribosome-binding protein